MYCLVSGGYQQLAVPGVRGLQPYLPGADPDLVAQKFGLAQVVKLASNENPLGSGELVRQALCSMPDMGRYPDGNASLLRATVADILGVDPAQLIFGNGSNEVLELAVRTFAGPGRRVLCPQYSFAVFALAAKAVGAELDMVAVEEDFSVDCESLLQAVRPETSLLLLANPNNPTGAWLTAEALRHLLQSLPSRVVVVLDEAYFEYMVDCPDYGTAIDYCADFANLIVSRTFSKIHGLAGLRIGYAVAQPPLAELMNRVRQPFNNNVVALLAAQVALSDETHINASLSVNADGKKEWLQAAAEMRLPTMPSPANFVCLKMPVPGRDLARQLEQEGILLRSIDNYGLPNHIRVSFGLAYENEKAIAALRRKLKGHF